MVKGIVSCYQPARCYRNILSCVFWSHLVMKDLLSLGILIRKVLRRIMWLQAGSDPSFRENSSWWSSARSLGHRHNQAPWSSSVVRRENEPVLWFSWGARDLCPCSRAAVTPNSWQSCFTWLCPNSCRENTPTCATSDERKVVWQAQ